MDNNQYYNPLISPENELYRKRVRKFTETVIQPVAQRLDEEGVFSVETAKAMGEFGLLGIQIPKQYGGQGLDTLSYIIAVEELSRVDGSHAATVAPHNSLALNPIY